VNKVQMFSIYVFSILLGLVLGHTLFLYQPFQVQSQILVKIGYKNGRPIEQPLDLIAILDRQEFIARALGDDSKSNHFLQNTKQDGAYRYKLKANKTSDLVAIIITRRYFQEDVPDFDVEDALVKIADYLTLQQGRISDSMDSEIMDRYAKFTALNNKVMVAGISEGFQQRAEVVGGVDTIKKPLFLRWQCFVLMVVISVGIGQILIYLKGK